jgi:hypothetical protein
LVGDLLDQSIKPSVNLLHVTHVMFWFGLFFSTFPPHFRAAFFMRR